MAHADEDAKQAVAIEVAPENGNTLAAIPFAFFPIVAAFAVQMRADEALVGGKIGLVVGFPVKSVECIVVGQVLTAAIFSRLNATCA